MDCRKDSYKDVVEMKKVLEERRNFSFIFDINHALSNDPTLRLAEKFLRELADEITEVHLSGYEGYHDPLFKTRQTELIKAVSFLDVPIVVESIVLIEEIQEERDYILRVGNV